MQGGKTIPDILFISMYYRKDWISSGSEGVASGKGIELLEPIEVMVLIRTMDWLKVFVKCIRMLAPVK